MHRVNGIVSYADYATAANTEVAISTTSTAASAQVITGAKNTAVVRFVANDGCHLLVGASDVGAATSAHYRIPANTPVYIGFSVDFELTHFRCLADNDAKKLWWGLVT
ncbi:MAG: hypothetical protein DRH30_10050 [Deltaproteobacteria bacterium]|nr:MAG: hypothetical protein DRH30_10050 [Deltaproteobacteria bacterium]